MPLAFITPVTAAIVLVVVLLVLGPKRLTGVGKALGSNMKDFKESVTGEDEKKGLGAAPKDRDESTTAETADEQQRTPRA